MDSGERKSLNDSKFEELDVKAQCDLLGLGSVPKSVYSEVSFSSTLRRI